MTTATDRKIDQVQNGMVIQLDRENSQDREFAQIVFGFDAENRGWFREKDRLFVFGETLTREKALLELKKEPPLNVLDATPTPDIDGESVRELFRMDDGTVVRWIRHPKALPQPCRPHWRDHLLFFEFENEALDYVAYHAIHRLASIEGADGKPRFFSPGGIRWVDYPNRDTAISDALDMSLAVSMKIEVVRTPCAGSKVAVVADRKKKPEVLRSLSTAMERMGLNISAADLGLSTEDLKKYALPYAPTMWVPIGVYEGGFPSSQVTYKGTFEGLKGMVASLAGSPAIGDVRFSIQGLGEVGYGVARLLIEAGAKLTIAEVQPDTIHRFKEEFDAPLASGQVRILDRPDDIYDVPADIFCPCALRDILTEANLARFLKAGVKMIGGPANNIFPDQTAGPWRYHDAGIVVIPYEGIGAGGVTGVSHAIMTGIFGKCPFDTEEKIGRIGNYVAKVIRFAAAYNLPPQIISDRILFQSVQRRTLVGRSKAFELIEILAKALENKNRTLEHSVIEEYTKIGFFSGPGRFPEGGWQKLAK